MKKFITPPEEVCYISCMSKVGGSEKPDFMVGVFEEGSHIEEPYLKIYDNHIYGKTKRVTRLSLLDGHRIVHKNFDGREEWKDINNRVLKGLDNFLEQPSRNYAGYTNWEVLIYLWNYETSIITPAPSDRYVTDIEAYFDGYYDTPENLRNPAYMVSTAKKPIFRK